ncbi:MAG: DUF3419 family protein [Myxococcota bacterium]|nr:DUF3419 family protein [Myxococcota bacterium]
MREIEEVLKDGVIRYAQVWEDSNLLEKGLNIQPDDRILSIGSAGDNAFALLLEEPQTVVAVDLNPAQTSLIELKLAAIQEFEHDDFLSLLGLKTDKSAVELYKQIKAKLPDYAQAFWDNQTHILETGLVNHGRLEQYFKNLRTICFDKFVDSDALNAFCRMNDPAKQAVAFEELIAHPKFLPTFIQYTGPDRIAQEGRDPAQFKFVTMEEVGEYFFNRMKTISTTLPMRSNFYMHQFYLGGYVDLETVPPYLKAENYEKLRSLLPRFSVEMVPIDQPVRHHPKGYFNKANLSDLFEYLSEEQTTDILGVLADKFRSGGRIAYWNLLVPRHRTESLAPKLKRCEDLSQFLYRQDRNLFYRDFHIEEVV